MKEDITKRLNEIMQFYSLRKSDFSKKIGLDNYSTITRIASGDYRPSYEVLNRIINSFPEVNATWLLTGKGEMLNNQETSQNNTTDKAKIIDWLNRELEDKREIIRHLMKQADQKDEEVKSLKSELSMLEEGAKKKELNMKQ